jgi:cobalt-zinc-cadmium efflux system protein
VVAGAIYVWLGWAWVDPAVSLIIAAVVVAGRYGPRGSPLPEVQGLYELHVWGMANSETALTAHLVWAIHWLTGTCCFGQRHTCWRTALRFDM